MKTVYIISGVPGCGKSTLAKEIAGDCGIICEADAFHYVNGVYDWKPENVKPSHDKCFEQFKSAIDNGVRTVINSNTNTTIKEWARYNDYAIENGYIVFKIIVENHHHNDSIHSVPQATREAMADRIKNSMKLI